jgi:hypothetical protein
MDELDRLAEELRDHIRSMYSDTPELMGLWLRLIDQDMERLRREDDAAAQADSLCGECGSVH